MTVVVSSLAVLVYNISGMYVTDQVGAAARTVLENARTLLVWLVSSWAGYAALTITELSVSEDQHSWYHWLIRCFQMSICTKKYDGTLFTAAAC